MKLKNTLISFILKFIINNINYSNTDIEKIQYGLEILFINFFKIIILFITASLLGIFRYTLISFLVFSILRTFACGAHGNSSFQCIIINYIIFFSNVYCSIYINLNNLFLIIVFLISIILIYMYAPADTEERPLISRKLRCSLKKKSIVVAIFFLIVALLIKNSIYSSLIIYSVLSESLVTTPAFYKILKKPYNNYKKIKL